MNVNLRGVFLCTQIAIAHMRRQQQGAIVNVASELGIVGAPDCAAYCASKGAVIQLTRAMAVDHAAEGIRINCVCPGAVETPLLDTFLDATGDRKRAIELTARGTLMGRLGRPDEIAGVIAFLASSDASYMTGAIVVADGGTIAR
jgi:NAD(P)-dependent dehydrogenase (short-subunit alcohol dehydrogenase family)